MSLPLSDNSEHPGQSFHLRRNATTKSRRLAVAEGAEFQINTYIPYSQWGPSVAALCDGGFVVVWSSNQVGATSAVYGQMYNASGLKNGVEFKISSYTSTHNDPSVAGLSGGGFVVTWSSYNQDGSGFGIYGQLYMADGVEIGTEFQVNTYIVGSQFGSCVAGLNDSNFVVTWISEKQDGSVYGVYGQMYAADGAKNGAEFGVNTNRNSFQIDNTVSVVGLSNGEFVATWFGYEQDGSDSEIYGQMFTASGAKNGAEFQVNTYTTNDQKVPSVAALSNGEFIVVWQSGGQDGFDYGVYGQMYTTSGSHNGAEFQINTYTADDQKYATVAGLSTGGFVVTWTSYGQDSSSYYGVYGQVYASSGAKSGSEFQVNTYTADSQGNPSVAGLNSGEFVVVWESAYQDGSGSGIFGRLFSTAIAPSNSHSPSLLLIGATLGAVSACVVMGMVLYFLRTKLSVLCSNCNKRRRSIYTAVPPVPVESDDTRERNLPVAVLVSDLPSADLPHALVVPGGVVLGSPSAEAAYPAEYPQAETNFSAPTF
jgi:hypothetical protein